MDRNAVKKQAIKLFGLDFNYKLYKFKNIPKQFITVTKDIKNDIKHKLLPCINLFQDFNIVFAHLDNNVGVYIRGSYNNPSPIILIDYVRLLDITLMWAYELELTILHEIAHAIQDNLNTSLNEKEAERFAKVYFKYEKIIKIGGYNLLKLKDLR